MQCFTTANLSPRRRIHFWNEVAADVLAEMEISPCSGTSFDGTLDVEVLGCLGIGRASSTPARISRTSVQIARAKERVFLINLCNRGRFSIAQGGHEALLQEGDFTISDTAEPFQMRHHTACEAIVVRVPEGTMREHIPRAEMLSGRAISAQHGIGAIASSVIRTLGQQMSGGLTIPPDSSVPSALLDILAAACGCIPGVQITEGATTGAKRLRIRRFIEMHLRDPELTPRTVSAAFAISERYVRAVFTTDGEAVAAYILRRRLEECARRLRDPLWSSTSVSQIAFEWAFNSLGGFSRSFKARYGVTPREYRNAAA